MSKSLFFMNFGQILNKCIQSFNIFTRLNVYSRWYLLTDEMCELYFPKMNPVVKMMIKLRIRRFLGKMSYTIGIGRHSRSEVQEMMKHDLRQLSNILGECFLYMIPKVMYTSILSQVERVHTLVFVTGRHERILLLRLEFFCQKDDEVLVQTSYEESRLHCRCGASQ